MEISEMEGVWVTVCPDCKVVLHSDDLDNFKDMIHTHKCAAQQSVHLTALRRGLNLSFSVNIFLAVLLVISLIGGK